MSASLCTCSYTLKDAFHSKPSTRSSFRGPQVSPGWRRREHKRVIKALASPHHLQELLAPLLDHAFLAYERVVFPCQSMNCGDAVYRR